MPLALALVTSIDIRPGESQIARYARLAFLARNALNVVMTPRIPMHPHAAEEAHAMYILGLATATKAILVITASYRPKRTATLEGFLPTPTTTPLKSAISTRPTTGPMKRLSMG